MTGTRSLMASSTTWGTNSERRKICTTSIFSGFADGFLGFAGTAGIGLKCGAGRFGSFFQRGMLCPAQNLAGAIALHHAVIDLGKDAGIAAKIGVVTSLPQALVAHHPRAGAAQAGGCFVRRIRFANQTGFFLASTSRARSLPPLVYRGGPHPEYNELHFRKIGISRFVLSLLPTSYRSPAPRKSGDSGYRLQRNNSYDAAAPKPAPETKQPALDAAAIRPAAHAAFAPR